MLLMGFPDCGSSYFLLMQLDKDFKPLFKLLETQPELSGKAQSFNDLNHVMRSKKIDIAQMQILEDEMTLSLFDWKKVNSFLPSGGGPNQASENGLLPDVSLEGSMHVAGCPTSSFSSVVDEVFELERGSSVPMNVPMNFHSIKARTPSPKWEGGMQVSQISNATKISNMVHYNGTLYSSSNLKGPVQSNSLGSLSSGSGRSTSVKKLSASKSEQDLASLRSPQSVEFGTSLDEDQLRLLNDTSNSSKHAMYGRSSRLLSPPLPTGPRISGSYVKPNGPRSSPTGPLTGSFRVAGSSSCATAPICKTSSLCNSINFDYAYHFHTNYYFVIYDSKNTLFSAQALDSVVCHSPSHEILPKHDRNSRKRTVSDMLNSIPSLQGVETNSGFCKRRKTSEASRGQQSSSQVFMPVEMISKTDGYSFGSLIAEANKGNAPSSVYVSALLHVVRHCSLCIKHARLTGQMEELDIPYVEEVGLRSGSSNIWLRLPFVRGDTWKHICLRLGRPGSMYWDVKINDQHFTDLWELQKGSSTTPWGSGVRIANTSDIDSHIRYDPEGVVLSYQSVEADSIKKLVADIHRLYNARMFALGMRKLLGVRADEKVEESSTNSDVKASVGFKGSIEAVDRLSEQMRRAFRIEAVGLMSLWFSFGSGVVARFVVEWESDKEGCTMHVSPDQLWPHTKVISFFSQFSFLIEILPTKFVLSLDLRFLI